MAKPWERYQSAAAPTQKPWEKYAAAPEVAAAEPDPVEQPKPGAGLETGRMRRPVVTGQIRNSPEYKAADQAVGDLVAGAVRGAGSIGSSLLWLNGAVAGKDWNRDADEQRRAGMDDGLQAMGADPESATYKAGKVGGEALGTLGVGGVLANGARAVGASAPIVQGLASGGLNVAGKTGALGLLTRGVTGAAAGGVTAGMVNPEDAKLGAIVGGAIPVSAKALATGARAAGSALAGQVSPEVAALAGRAKQLGIDIPADRITNSKPLNLVASSLDYMPFSGRSGTMDRMSGQLNRAVSRTFGQDSDNVAQAVKSARGELGGEFDRVLKANTVRVDQQFTDDLAQHLERAAGELGADGERVIGKQVADIAAKIKEGQIDGQAAYNIKQTLDRIAKQNSPVSSYAKDLKNSLMSALDRSLGADEAAAFAKTRQQYGNMKTIEKLVGNGVEGDVSIARLANQKGIYNKDLQELADISAQFLKSRESAHGAAQRLSLGSLGVGATGMASLPLALGAVAGGRATNSLLNSDAARRMVMGGLLNQPPPLMIKRGLLGASKVAPVLTAQ